MADTKEVKNNKEKRYTFGEHLDELRSRIIYSIIAVVFCFCVCWFFKAQILQIIKRPHIIAMEGFGLSPALQVISYQEGFYAYIKLCFIAAIFFAYPMIMYQLWRFVSPGLYKKERDCLILFIAISFVAFITGISFGYFFLVPIGLRFLIGILGTGIAPIITIGQYVSFVVLLTIALGMVFQLPLIMYLLIRVGLVSAERFISWRKYAVLLAFIISAVITPPDPFTQTMAAVPMIALYEIGILISRPTRKGIIYLCTMIGGGSLSIFLFFMIYTHLSTLGTILMVKGEVILGTGEGHRVNEALLKDATRDNIRIYKGMALRTGYGGKMAFDTKEGIKIILDTDTQIKITGNKTIQMAKGQIFISVPEIELDFEVVTPNCIARTHNGEINIQTSTFETIVTVAKGTAVLVNGDTKRTIMEGRQVNINTGGDIVNIDDVIKWTQ